MKKIKVLMSRVPLKLKYLLLFVLCNLGASIVYPSLKAYAEAERGYTGAFGGETAVWFVAILVILIVDTIRVGRIKDETQKDR